MFRLLTSPLVNQKITITNDKGRLSKEEIEKMVNDAEKFKAEDDLQKERIAAKNGLESYCFNMKSTVEDDKLKGKISESDLKTISDKWEDTTKWLDQNQSAEVDEFKHKQSEIEGICNPIVSKLYQQGQAPQNGMPSGQTNSGPTVEEVD